MDTQSRSPELRLELMEPTRLKNPRTGGDSPSFPDQGSAFILAGSLALAATVLVGRGTVPVAAMLVVLSILAAWHRWLLTWHALCCFLIAVVLFIPVGRYSLPINLPFGLDLYRVAVALLLVAWIAALLVDENVRLRRTPLDAPVTAIVATTLGSIAVNAGRVTPLAAPVLKGVTVFLSFVILFYLISSVVRTTAAVVRVTKVIVSGVGAVAFFAIIEQRTGFNLFDHVRAVLPFLRFDGSEASTRYGVVRAVGSADHPIALGVLFAMIVPVGVALAKTRSSAWWIPTLLVLIGVLATASRTPVIAIVVSAAVLLWLRPRDIVPLLPLMIPMLIVIKVIAPGSLATLKNSFLPQGGPSLIASQRALAGDPTLISGRANFKPKLKEGMRSRPLLGQGWGTRQTGADNPLRNAPILDNQWLSTFLDVGILGFAAWLWLIVRAARGLGQIARTRGSPDGFLAASLAASIIGFAVAAVTYDSLAFTQQTFVLWLLFALSGTLIRVHSETRNWRSEPTLVGAGLS